MSDQSQARVELSNAMLSINENLAPILDAADGLIEQAAEYDLTPAGAAVVAQAQVHATLALAQAVAGFSGSTYSSEIPR